MGGRLYPTMDRTAAGRVFSNLHDPVGADVHPLSRGGTPVVTRLYIVVRSCPTTILPPTPRPGDRLPRGLYRYSARYVEAHNDRDFEPDIEPSNDANVFSNNVSNNFASNAWYNAACNRSCSSRRSSLFSCRRTCRCSSQHSRRYLCRYFPTYFVGYFVRSNRSPIARQVGTPVFRHRARPTQAGQLSSAASLATSTLSSSSALPTAGPAACQRTIPLPSSRNIWTRLRSVTPSRFE